MALLRSLTFLLTSLNVTLTVLNLFLFSDAYICSTMAFPPLEILIVLFSQFSSNSKGIPRFIAWLMFNHMLIGMNIWEMFHVLRYKSCKLVEIPTFGFKVPLQQVFMGKWLLRNHRFIVFCWWTLSVKSSWI